LSSRRMLASKASSERSSSSPRRASLEDSACSAALAERARFAATVVFTTSSFRGPCGRVKRLGHYLRLGAAALAGRLRRCVAKTLQPIVPHREGFCLPREQALH